MQALVIRSHAPLQIDYVTDHPPPQPPPGEALVRVRLAGICSTDVEITQGYMHFTGVPGHEFVGVVERGPEHLIGRRIVAEINCPCGTCNLCRCGLPNHCPHRTVLGIAGRDGAFAEYLTIPANNCHIVPENVSDEQAVFVEPLAAAAHVLDATAFTADTRVALLGSGRLGLLTARVLIGEPCKLTVVGRNPATLALCAATGIQTCLIEHLPSDAQFDVVIECTGMPDGLRLALKLCRPTGTIVLKSTYAHPEAVDLAPIVINEARVVGSRCGDFARALRLLAAGRVRVDDLVTGTYPLSDGVAALAAAGGAEHLKVLLQPGTA